MDFNVNAGDDDSSFACNLPDGCFASQDLRAGFLGGIAMHRLPPPLSDREAIGREIMKERIRQEILAREMAERRILEEEVRREIEIERMEMRMFNMVRSSVIASTTNMVMYRDPPSQLFSPCWPQARSRTPIGLEFVHDAAEVVFRERSPSHMLQKKTLAGEAQSSSFHKPEKSPQSNEFSTPNCNSSGTKRKARLECLPSAEKQWGCALCEVISTSEKGLEQHLQGKKHKTKALQSSKQTGQSQSNKNMTLQSDVASASGPGTKQKKLRCVLCRVKCNSEAMLDIHRNGKRHKAFMELKKHTNTLQTEAGKAQTKNLVDSEGVIKE